MTWRVRCSGAEQARRLRSMLAFAVADGRVSRNVDTLKGRRSRTVALPAAVVPILDLWSAGQAPSGWMFSGPGGGPLSESNWKRSLGWRDACAAIGRPTLRAHDLRHTAASIWLGAGADPKVVQRILGHASAAMTMDLYGRLIDRNLWEAAQKVGGTTGASDATSGNGKAPDSGEKGA